MISYLWTSLISVGFYYVTCLCDVIISPLKYVTEAVTFFIGLFTEFVSYMSILLSASLYISFYQDYVTELFNDVILPHLPSSMTSWLKITEPEIDMSRLRVRRTTWANIKDLFSTGLYRET